MTDKPLSPLRRAIQTLGCGKIAKLCGIRGPSVHKWRDKDRLPRTEWTGETNYSKIISDALNGEITREELLVLPTLEKIALHECIE